MREGLSQCIKSSQPIRLDDVSFTTSQGEQRFLGLTLNPISKPYQDISGCLILARDITERKKTEEKLRESENEKTLVLDNTSEIIAYHDTNHNLQWANKAYLKATGLSLQELKGQKCYLAWGLDRLCNNCPVTKAVEAGEPQEAELTPQNQEHWPPNQGSWISKAAPVRDSTGSIIGAIEIAYDITERKQTEEEIKSLKQQMEYILGATKTGLDIIDSQFNIKYIDPEWKKVYGDTTGRKCYEYFMDRDEVCPGCGIVKALETKSITVTEEILVKENHRPTQATTIPFQNDEGEWLAARVNVDMTEHRKMEVQMRQVEKMQSIGQLASGIAHEINTPTQYIGDNINFLQESFKDILRLLSEYEQMRKQAEYGTVDSELLYNIQDAMKEIDMGYLTEEIPKAVQASLEGVGNVARIVQAMKEFAHPGASEKTAADINQAIESTITVTRSRWKYIADLETDLDPELPPVHCLIDELNQVMLNLIVNAADAITDKLGEGSENKGMISISTRRDAEWAEIRVADNGSGIPEKIRERILDPFFTTKEIGKGSGHGLAIAYSIIVNKHGGTLIFETEMGEGTTFIIRLPIEADVSSGDEQDEEEYSIC
ncbi:ATP-binding protein [Planctomycetota bacterium]